MSIINFDSIRNLVGSGNANQQQELFQEVLLMVLARATRVDSNVESVEVEQVKKVLKEKIGVEFSNADILTAASSELFEQQPLVRYLSRATRKLNEQERATIIESLAIIIRSDEEVRYGEIDFFNQVAMALRATPAEIAGLLADDGA